MLRSQETLPQAPPTTLAPLSGREEELLLVAYLGQFGGGAGAQRTYFDWRPWAEAVGLSEREALTPLRGLANRRLAEYADPYGYWIRLSLAGVFKAEKSLLAEPAFVARQRESRRRILETLLRIREAEDSSTGRTIEDLAAAVGEPARSVAANCVVLRDIGFVSVIAAEEGDLYLLEEDGLHALSGWNWWWPLN
jgi:hypothetical protein